MRAQTKYLPVNTVARLPFLKPCAQAAHCIPLDSTVGLERLKNTVCALFYNIDSFSTLLTCLCMQRKEEVVKVHRVI